jgi:hypothetical protein
MMGSADDLRWRRTAALRQRPGRGDRSGIREQAVAQTLSDRHGEAFDALCVHVHASPLTT